MARLARVVAADVPHHVTQRGNARRFILAIGTDRSVYLTLLRENIESCRVSGLRRRGASTSQPGKRKTVFGCQQHQHVRTSLDSAVHLHGPGAGHGGIHWGT